MKIVASAVERLSYDDGRPYLKLVNRAGKYVDSFGPEHTAVLITQLDTRIKTVETKIRGPILSITLAADITEAEVSELMATIYDAWPQTLANTPGGQYAPQTLAIGVECLGVP